MKKILTTSILFVLIISAFGTPTDNPLRTFYGNGNYPIWTDSIKWDNVVDMSSYSNGANAFEKFENAQNDLALMGGGVLYYPAGNYDFSDMPAHGKDGRGLMLKSGIIIRGEKPDSDSVSIDGSIGLGTIFHFPTQLKEGMYGIPEDWGFIGISKPASGNLREVKNIGVVYVQIEFGHIFWGCDAKWGATYATAGAWKSSLVLPDWQDRVPDGTNPFDFFCGSPGTDGYYGSGNGRLVFGCHLHNSTVSNNVYFDGYSSGYTGYFMYKFGARISIYASNVFVANNCLSKPDTAFKYQQTTNSLTEKTLLFDFGNIFGIDINKNYLNIFSNKYDGYLEENVVVNDNYVWNHGRNGFSLSGKYIIVKNNYNDRAYLSEGDNVYGIGTGWELTLDGYNESEAGGSGSKSDNLSRAFDMSGSNGWIDSNRYHGTGSNPGNDGEGILWQAHGGMSTIESFALTNNNGTSGYMAGYDVGVNGALWAWNTTSVVGNYKAGGMYDVSIFDNSASITTTTEVSVLKTCPTGTPTPPSVSASLSTNKDYVEITWTDNSDNEVGYRVEKKIGTSGDWKLLCYRPRKDNVNPSAANKLIWRDYSPGRGIDNYYRVVAFNCDNDDLGASSESSAIYIDDISTSSKSAKEKDAIKIWPNPASEKVYFSQTIKNIKVMSIHGEILINSANKNELDISNLPSGIYLIKAGNIIEKIIIK